MHSKKSVLYCWLLNSLPLDVASCPFASKVGPPPDDDVHRRAGLRRRLTPLRDDPVTKAKLDGLLRRRAERGGRALQADDSCVAVATYDAIDEDVAALSAAFPDDVTRAHFLGGVVRLAAHDFMDYDRSAVADPMGADGCLDLAHSANAGLPDIWCEGCDLTRVYDDNYAAMSRADFWVAAAQAVIRLTSGGALDLRDSYVYGRVDADSCASSAERLPGDVSCADVEAVFLDRLGLTWTDAVALLGAHTIGRGSASGHEGIWVETEEESVRFNKRYYEEILRRAWRPRNQNTDVQDWTWGGRNDVTPRFMLNADMCLAFDIATTFPCCTNVNTRPRGDGTNQCDGRGGVLSDAPCGAYPPGHARVEAANAVRLFAQPRDQGGFRPGDGPFFEAFARAWGKATTNGRTNLQPLAASCASSSPTARPINRPSPTNTPSTMSPTRNPSPAPTTAGAAPTPAKATKSKATKTTKTAKTTRAGTVTSPFE